MYIYVTMKELNITCTRVSQSPSKCAAQFSMRHINTRIAGMGLYPAPLPKTAPPDIDCNLKHLHVKFSYDTIYIGDLLLYIAVSKCH